jgi:hypothetical protein
MIARLICGLCAAALCAGTAVAGETSSKSTPRGDPDKVVCRVSQDTGSRLGKIRVCKTNAQWAEMRRQTQETIDHIQNNRAANLN